MTTIKLSCRGAAARAAVEGPITAGAVGIPVEIDCDESWDGLIRTLVCMTAVKRVNLAGVGNRAEVAWEVLVPGLHLYLGLEGRSADGRVVIPTVWADCGRILPGAEGEHNYRPTPNEMEQLLILAGVLQNRIGNMEQLETTARDSLVSAINESLSSLRMEQILAISEQMPRSAIWVKPGMEAVEVAEISDLEALAQTLRQEIPKDAAMAEQIIRISEAQPSNPQSEIWVKPGSSYFEVPEKADFDGLAARVQTLEQNGGSGGPASGGGQTTKPVTREDLNEIQEAMRSFVKGVKISREDYDLLESKDPDTLYIIVGDGE